MRKSNQKRISLINSSTNLMKKRVKNIKEDKELNAISNNILYLGFIIFI